MFRVIGSRTISQVLAMASLVLVSCAKGVMTDPGQDSSTDDSKRVQPYREEEPNESEEPENCWESDDPAACECTIDSDDDGVVDCEDECPLGDDPFSCPSCAADSDEDGIVDCKDECPLTYDGVAVPWYPDCDGDGQASLYGELVCDGEPPRSPCEDELEPDGGWAESPGSDCNDEAPSVIDEREFFADCDDDGSPGPFAIRACDIDQASDAFDCDDGSDPAGGFSEVEGTDCDDEDGTVATPSEWYPDCDGDGSFATSATLSCGVGAAQAEITCENGAPPDDFSATQGTDCNDENQTVSAVTTWYPDCDGDGEAGNTTTLSCGTPAETLTTCLDGESPDGGYATQAGVDCNDELRTNPCACGYQDDDGDKTCTLPPPRSCLEILTRNQLAVDGDYEIDPDGNASTAPILVKCQMTAGGWTLISREDFAAGQVGWQGSDGSPSPVDTSTSCATAFTRYLGGPQYFGQGALARKTFNLLGIPHTELSVKLDYIVIDSWDNEAAVVSVDSVERFRATYGQTAPKNLCGGGWVDMGKQAVDLTLGHSKNSANVSVTSTLNSAASDESFGIDNVVIRVR